MKTVKLITALLCMVSLITFYGCKSYQVDYTSHEGEKMYSLNKDKISKKEKEAWVTSTNANSVNSYKKYLQDFPNGKYAAEAQSILSNANSRNYALLNIFPTDPYNQNLKSLFDSPNESKPVIDETLGIFVDAQTGKPFSGKYDGENYKNGNIVNFNNNPPPTEDDDWAFASSSSDDWENDKARLEDFLQKYPNGKYATEANAKLILIKAKIKKEKESTEKTANDNANDDERNRMLAKDAKAWALAYRLNTVQGYNDYLSQFSDGKYVAEATAGLMALENQVGSTGSSSSSSSSGSSSSGSGPTPSEIVAGEGIIIPFLPDTSVITSVLTEECAINAKMKGAVAYDELPKVMQLDSIYNLRIIMNELGSLDKIAEELKDKEGIDLDEEKVKKGETQTVGDFKVSVFEIGSWVRVTLKELEGQDAFKITNVLESKAENQIGQNIDCDKNAEWYWKIAPKKSGKHTLFLLMEMKKTKDGDYKPIDNAGKIEKTIIVDVATQPWYAQLWAQLLMGGGALLALFFIFWKNRKQQPQEDYVFGANLGIAGGIKDIATPPAKPKSVFIAYAKEDEEWTKQIYNQMKVLQKGGFTNVWYDQLMEAGVEYKEEIFKHLEQSDIIILNISSDFLACDFCDELMQKAMDRQSKGEGVILMPIIVRPCLWATTPLKDLHVFPQNKKPLSDEEWKNVDNAIVNVMNEMEPSLLN